MSTALSSLYGSKKREQTVLTGDRVVSFVHDFYDGTISMDPCAAPAGPVWVECCSCKGRGVKGEKACKPCKGAGGSFQLDSLNVETHVRLSSGGDGLAVVWTDKTFVNPPYNVLAPWLTHPLVAGECIWYVPVRPNRKWWRAWARSLDALAFLNPQKFKGHAQSFPAALCLAYRGPRAHDFNTLIKKHELGGNLTDAED